MLEYQPEPWDEWVTVGKLQLGVDGRKKGLAVKSQQLPCLSGILKILKYVSSLNLSVIFGFPPGYPFGTAFIRK